MVVTSFNRHTMAIAYQSKKRGYAYDVNDINQKIQAIFC